MARLSPLLVIAGPVPPAGPVQLLGLAGGGGGQHLPEERLAGPDRLPGNVQRHHQAGRGGTHALHQVLVFLFQYNHNVQFLYDFILVLIVTSTHDPTGTMVLVSTPTAPWEEVF